MWVVICHDAYLYVDSVVYTVYPQCFCAGIVFAKFTKPTSRAETILFSKNALITLRNGCYYLVLRLGDLRPSHLIECHVSGHFISSATTEEGESVPYNMQSLQFGSNLDGSADYIQPLWPLVVSHRQTINTCMLMCKIRGCDQD